MGFINKCDNSTAKLISESIKMKYNPCIINRPIHIPRYSQKYIYVLLLCKKDIVLNKTTSKIFSKYCNGTKEFHIGDTIYKKVYYVIDETNGEVYR